MKKKVNIIIFIYFYNKIIDKKAQNEGTLSVFQVALQISNCILGAGILGIPLMYQEYGIILSTLLIIFFAIIISQSSKLLFRCNTITERCGYSLFAKICYGTCGSTLVKLVIILNTFGVTCAYFRIFGDICAGLVKSFVHPTKLEENFWTDNWHNWFYIVCAALIMSVFIFKDRMDGLKVSFFLNYF